MKRTGCVLVLLIFWSVLSQAQNPSNFEACKYGYANCDSSRLTPDEQTQVVVAAHARNLSACKYGYTNCDSSRLTPDEEAQVVVAAHARNFSACKYGYANCDSSRLTPDEQAQVVVAARARNLSACKYRYANCNPSLLTGAESAQISSSRTATTPVAESPVPAAGVAENGSYYGELNANGVPKTVHVNGYYRKDGTYVRGHYRSAPGTNPPRSRGSR